MCMDVLSNMAMNGKVCMYVNMYVYAYVYVNVHGCAQQHGHERQGMYVCEHVCVCICV